MRHSRWLGSGRPHGIWSAIPILLSALSIWSPTSNAAIIRADAGSLAGGLDLRVLAIGDSITYGAPNAPFNGYRKPLLKKLTDLGNKVEFVGSIHAGDFDNNACEGHRGKVIHEISDMSAEGIYAGPNIVLLHAGTNDCNRPYNPSMAPSRLSDLIGYIISSSNDAVVLVAQIIPSRTEATEKCVVEYNKAIPDIVKQWKDKGKSVFMVDMYTDFKPNDLLADYLHPNTAGYQEMANRWMTAINQHSTYVKKAPAKRTPPSKPADHCGVTPVWEGKGEIAAGAKVAHADGPFQQAWDKVGTFSTHECDPSQLFFPDLDGDGFGDWACVQKDDGAVLASLQVPTNGKPGNNWQKLGIVATGSAGRKSSGVFFADVNGDGKDDYVYVDNGNVHVWINGGASESAWLWNYIGLVNGNDVGATRDNLQMVDINGDGRADFLIVNDSTGEVTAWLNGGPADKPDYYKVGVIATGKSKAETDIVIMGDFTGNGLADYMLVGQQGKVIGSANQLQERGFIPKWADEVTVAAGPAGATQQYVRLTDVNGDGKVDYILLDKNGGAQLWLNTGTSGKWQVGDGLFLADRELPFLMSNQTFTDLQDQVDGDGANDYIWMDGQGNTFGYLNRNNGSGTWNNKGQIRPSGGNVDLRHVRWAPFTSSRRADYVFLNEQGAAFWSQNLGSQGDGQPFRWGNLGVLATSPRNVVVAAPYNWKWNSKRIKFADVTGDGLADYLYVNTNGAVLMWKNLGTNPPTWGTAQLIAAGPKMGVWWSEIQFADTDASGVADYIHVDRITGRAEFWRNNGFNNDGSIKWNGPVSFAAGPGPAGYNIRVVDMTGEGRADYVSVDPITGGLTLWKNNCPADTGTS